MHFASVKEATIHNKPLHKARNANQPQQLPQLHKRPQRFAARLRGGLLCALDFQERDWVAFDDAYFQELDLPDLQAVKSAHHSLRNKKPRGLKKVASFYKFYSCPPIISLVLLLLLHSTCSNIFYKRFLRLNASPCMNAHFRQNTNPWKQSPQTFL